jgi:hypothetical protein
MRDNETTDTVASVQYVTKGNGSAIHIAHVYSNGNLATLCDKWGSSGAYGSRVRPVAVEAATCKSCLKNAGE